MWPSIHGSRAWDRLSMESRGSELSSAAEVFHEYGSKSECRIERIVEFGTSIFVDAASIWSGAKRPPLRNGILPNRFAFALRRACGLLSVSKKSGRIVDRYMERAFRSSSSAASKRNDLRPSSAPRSAILAMNRSRKSVVRVSCCVGALAPMFCHEASRRSNAFLKSRTKFDSIFFFPNLLSIS